MTKSGLRRVGTHSAGRCPRLESSTSMRMPEMMLQNSSVHTPSPVLVAVAGDLVNLDCHRDVPGGRNDPDAACRQNQQAQNDPVDDGRGHVHAGGGRSLRRKLRRVAVVARTGWQGRGQPGWPPAGGGVGRCSKGGCGSCVTRPDATQPPGGFGQKWRTSSGVDGIGSVRRRMVASFRRLPDVTESRSVGDQ
jgi:hypothetical protein